MAGPPAKKSPSKVLGLSECPSGVCSDWGGECQDLELASVKAHEYVIDLEELHAKLREQMAKAQACYQGPVDRQREPTPDFQVGPQVYVSAEHIRTTRPSKKIGRAHV